MNDDRTFWEQVYPKVEGFLLDEEARLLFELAGRDGPAGSVVEIGSWKGKSSVVFGHVAKKKGLGKVYSIDPHTGSPEHGKVWTFPDFQNNVKMAGLEDVINPIIKTSEDAVKFWDGSPVRLLWIDGNHDYEFAKSDFLLWEPHVAVGGVVAFHDTVWAEGVARVMKELFFSSPRFRNFRFAGNIVCAEKCKRASFTELLGNAMAYRRWQMHGWNSKRKWRVPAPMRSVYRLLVPSK